MKIAVLASSHGLGHIRRCIILCNELSKQFNTTLFASIKKINQFKLNNKVKKKNLILNLFTRKKILKKNEIHQVLKIKDKFDIYLSDNNPEVALNNNSFLLSNFFWHDILKINTEYYKKLEKRIAKRPIMANYLFVSKYIKKKFQIKPVGFYGNFKSKKFSYKRNGILISFGTAFMKNDNSIEKFIFSLSERTNKQYPIYLEPSYYKSKLKKYNVHKADYTGNMYSKIAFAIIKPGLGTITDCLSCGVHILTYCKYQNKEFSYNSKILENNNLGINFTNLNSALNFAQDNINNRIYLKKKFYLAKKLKWNGEKTVIEVIKYYFKNKLLLMPK